MADKHNYTPEEIFTRKDEFISKVRSDIRSSGAAHLFYDGNVVYSRPRSSKRINSASNRIKINYVYSRDSDDDIIDQCQEFIIKYHQRQKAQSKRLISALGANNAGRNTGLRI
jgi:hypothetical protein